MCKSNYRIKKLEVTEIGTHVLPKYNKIILHGSAQDIECFQIPTYCVYTLIVKLILLFYFILINCTKIFELYILLGLPTFRIINTRYSYCTYIIYYQLIMYGVTHVKLNNASEFTPSSTPLNVSYTYFNHSYLGV